MRKTLKTTQSEEDPWRTWMWLHASPGSLAARILRNAHASGLLQQEHRYPCWGSSSPVLPHVLCLGPIAAVGRAGWKTVSWVASGYGYLLDGRRASMLLRAEKQFGWAAERRVSFTEDKRWSPRMRHGAYCHWGPGCPEPTSVLQEADTSVWFQGRFSLWWLISACVLSGGGRVCCIVPQF